MKKLLSLAVIAVMTAVPAQAQKQVPVAERFVYHGTGNPYLPLWEHLPDGEPRVFADPDRPGHYRAYIIGSHDLRMNSYCGPDIRMWSAPVEDLSQWRDEGPIFTYKMGEKWDVMYAPDLVEVNRPDGTREYFLYPHSRGPRREAVVCKGPRPDGPFTPVNLTEDGQAAVPGSCMGFDPSVFIESVTDENDPDYEIGFRAYGFWGFQHSSAAQLDQRTMYSVRPGTERIANLLPALHSNNRPRFGQKPRPSKVNRADYMYIYPGEDLKAFNFFEASSIRQVGNKYVVIYSGHSGPDYGIGMSNSTLRYAYADTPLGPWKNGGILVDSRAPEVSKDGDRIITTNAAHNTHGSIEQINGQWYVFYHRPPRGFGFARQAMVAPIHVEADEQAVCDGGKVTITGFNPYAPDQKWMAVANNATYTGAEVTSEGFCVFGLNPYQYYSAGIACYLSDVGMQQDSWDIWDNHAPVTNVCNGAIVGFKYFGFGGLNEDKLGIKAFAPAKKGNKTQLNLWLEPRTEQAFKIHIWMDAPWNNAVHHGQEIATISVPAGKRAGVQQFKADVAKAVEDLTGKHAIYFVAEGGDGELCALMGLGFSGKGHNIARPVPPTISITVDGKAVEVPTTPIRSTDDNGICGYDQYEVKATTASAKPRIAAKASNGKVKITVEGNKVKCNYQGVVKTYNIVF